MRVLTKKDVQTVYSMKDAIADDKIALAAYSKGDATVPLRTNIDIKPDNGQSLYMPGYAAGKEPALGVKIVSVYPNNIDKGLPSVPATMVSLNPKTGIVSAIIDGTYPTQLRTGALQGAATDLMANSDAKVATLIGTGGQAPTQLEAMLNVRQLTRVYVSDIDKDRAAKFAQDMTRRFGKQFKVEILPAVDLQKAIRASDIITSVTTSKQATFDAADVKPGAHINGIGAYTPQMHEIPAELVKQADIVIFDTMDGVLAEAGDMISPLKNGLVSKDQYSGELGQLINGDIKGRDSHDQITLFKAVGTAVLDVVVAEKILQAAAKADKGTTIDL
ncbi:ornithine cyclodeaminase family protein [Lacticaseibacillus paracasei]|uniref:ornithine cyclodeaminase family protein n=1 Tax=Lacticaseibacillus paracasei TaxID=1597 RepID=UPI000FF802F0|nr:ornithine cyclodeaminase family protein [Lacticaseibacillus paracasei]RND59635.1 ornithine cyclodeaminase [Lacticaseibacillus paracasei]